MSESVDAGQRGLLEDQTADLELPALLDLRPPARPILALDYGVSFDRSAAIALYRLPVRALTPEADRGQDRPVFVAVPHLWPVATPLSEVVGDVVGAAVDPRYVATETNGVGAMPSQELISGFKGRRRGRREWALVATSAQSKTAGYGCILALLERGQLVLPRHPDLWRQLAGLKFEQGERGFTRIGASDAATHDDAADALYLCSLPTPGRRRLLCHLQALADPRRAPADAAVPELEGEVVETGGGLRVWRRPPLQSVSGVEVSLPPGVRAAEDAETAYWRRRHEAERRVRAANQA